MGRHPPFRKMPSHRLKLGKTGRFCTFCRPSWRPGVVACRHGSGRGLRQKDARQKNGGWTQVCSPKGAKKITSSFIGLEVALSGLMWRESKAGKL